MKTRLFGGVAFPALLGAMALLSITASGAAAATYKVLHSFCQEVNCVDGYAPTAGLVRDPAGNLFGTTSTGGPNGSGEVFELLPHRKSWEFKIIAHFCRKPDCRDGGFSTTKLIIDTNGNLYGTNNGSFGGAVFELIPNDSHTKWTERTLHAFCPTGGNCTDGLTPLNLSYQGAASGFPYDGVSPLYSTTALGGTAHAGTVFSLTPSAGRWKEKILYDFCAQPNCSDGFTPSSGVTLDPQGNLYGVTSGGGETGNSGTPEGVLYKLSPRKSRWTESVLYSFCRQKNCADGMSPTGTLVMDDSGLIFGEAGGGNITRNQYGGVIYSWNLLENVVHTFCPTKGCTDGQVPSGGLMIDHANNIFGVTIGGPATKANGTVFELVGGTTFITLHEFCGNGLNCKGGEFPNGDLIGDGAGELFGTTESGGTNSHGQPGGTVFELTP